MPGVAGSGGSSLFTGITSNRKTVTTAGTAEALVATSTPCSFIIITAETDNTNPVTIGGSDVVGALATRKGIPLSAGNSIGFEIDDVGKVFVDSITNTEGVTFIYFA